MISHLIAIISQRPRGDWFVPNNVVAFSRSPSAAHCPAPERVSGLGAVQRDHPGRRANRKIEMATKNTKTTKPAAKAKAVTARRLRRHALISDPNSLGDAIREAAQDAGLTKPAKKAKLTVANLAAIKVAEKAGVQNGERIEKTPRRRPLQRRRSPRRATRRRARALDRRPRCCSIF
jgi:hypothetical protein